MLQIQEFEKLRYRYEYGGESIPDICRAELYPIHELEAYAQKQQWRVVADPDFKNPDAVNQFYTDARQKVTVMAARRAITKYYAYADLEDRLIRRISHVLDEVETLPIPDQINAVSKLEKALSALQNNNKMYNEAIAAPATADRLFRVIDRIEGDTMETMEELRDEMLKRGLPLPEGL